MRRPFWHVVAAPVIVAVAGFLLFVALEPFGADCHPVDDLGDYRHATCNSLGRIQRFEVINARPVLLVLLAFSAALLLLALWQVVRRRSTR